MSRVAAQTARSLRTFGYIVLENGGGIGLLRLAWLPGAKDLVQLLDDPAVEQTGEVASLRAGDPFGGYDFVGRQRDIDSLLPVPKHRFAYLLQLVLEVRQIVGVPEPGELVDRIGVG